jgi:hypothetical protein
MKNARRAIGRAAICATSAFLGLCLNTTTAGGAVRAPPDPRVAAATFVEACWHGLLDVDRFERAIRGSPLGFQLISHIGSTSRYGGPMSVTITPDLRCEGELRFYHEADVGRLFDAIAEQAGLPAPTAETIDIAPIMHAYRWPAQDVGGGRLVLAAGVIPPSGGIRLEPEGFRITLSASFLPDP